MAKRFSAKRKLHWSGEWRLDEEIAAIPRAWWADTILAAASGSRFSSWRLARKADGIIIADIFPASSLKGSLPKPSIARFLSTRRRKSGENQWKHSDLLLCLRALSVIERAALSRGNSITGPLTAGCSAAGILEVSAGWASALNRLGFCSSRDTAFNYRMMLASKREAPQHGAFESIPAGLGALAVKADNWSMSPLHAAQRAGKKLAGINGCLIQGCSRKRKRSPPSEEMPEEDAVWKDAGSALANRAEFAESLTSGKHAAAVRHFTDVCLGLGHQQHRDKLLGGSAGSQNESETGPIHFRRLMLSAFKPHGGSSPSDSDLRNQRIARVDVDGGNAAEKVTIRKKLALLEAVIQPGEPGRPRLVAVAGGQPTRKMLSDIFF